MESLPLKLDDPETHREQINTSVNCVSSSAPNCDVPVKKPTRQWAAWTRQEEESFFTALRQVGKNFEKITRRVQSKNKDQVRHYYYRLVRRMNKLLGPELCLNSKNSKDTNAAMLRWWSLLEKYSCKASKLHLKPRRFKLFVEALETQLIKDRKKNTRKREIPFHMPPNSATYYDRQTPDDQRIVKLVFVDNQNMDKLSSEKGMMSPTSVIRGESSSLKPIRQRRKQGMSTSAAYKRWEKAAIAGMSLVADAAEHLERTTKNSDSEKGLSENQEAREEVSHAYVNVKLKLQLFPVDETTRRILELDKHNPFLELTLSNKKKISSVIEHLNKKWGKSNMENRKLFLFPYCVDGENAFGCQYWTQNSTASAADVFTAIGSPSIFILRYGWFSEKEFIQNSFGSSRVPFNHGHTSGIPKASSSSSNVASDVIGNEIGNVESSNPEKHLKTDGLRPNMDAISNVEWGDSFTNISIGDLLLDDPPPMDSTFAGELCQASFTCDSFDAAIAAHLLKHQKSSLPPFDPPPLSLWDAEETCDAFTFQIADTDIVHPQIVPSNIDNNPTLLKVLFSHRLSRTMHHNSCNQQPVEVPQELKSSTGFSDFYWTESLGALDELPPCKYQETEQILSDSFNSLNRFVTSSVDAFQNISFLSGQEKIASNT